MAKGVEDTTFYVYGPLLSVNEVGNKPEARSSRRRRFMPGTSSGRAITRRRCWPRRRMIRSAAKTSARLNVLAEVPRGLAHRGAAVDAVARRRRVEVDGLPAPGRGDEYHLYQSLIGIWPVAEEGAEHDLTKRMCQYMDKAGHEAKQRTSWINPNEPYDRAMQNFVSGVLDPRRDNRFLVDLRKWQRRWPRSAWSMRWPN